MLPPGLPGTITWKAKQTGISPYMLAMAASSQSGHDGNQARYYMAQMMHHRLRSMALAAANQQASAQPANIP